MQFIRCIQPNEEKQNGMFNNELVLKQLKTSSVISHAKFIRFGYSKRIAFQKLVDACEPIKKKLINVCGNPSKFYLIVMQSLGFNRNEFQMGNDVIFIRSNKFHLMEEFLSETQSKKANQSGITLSESIPQKRRDPLERIKKFVWHLKWKYVFNCVRFFGKFSTHFFIPKYMTKNTLQQFQKGWVDSSQISKGF